MPTFLPQHCLLSQDLELCVSSFPEWLIPGCDSALAADEVGESHKECHFKNGELLHLKA